MDPIASGDVVKLTKDHTPVTRGQWFVVDRPFESPKWGSCVHIRLIEHMPSNDWPRGSTSFARSVPQDWLVRDPGRTKQWKEAHERPE